MTKPEFERWWSDLTLRFPSMEAWLLRYHDSEMSQKTLLRTWLEVMGDVGLSHALDVNRLMQSGELEWPGGQKESYGFEERLPQHVRRLARQLAWEREGRIEQSDLPPLGDKGTGFPARAIIERMWDLQKQGSDRATARKQAMAELLPSSPSHGGPRYSCLNCYDSGRVHVASNTAIGTMLLGRFDECHHRDAVVRCSCGAGNRLVRKSQGRELPWVTFDSSLDFVVMDPLWQSEERRRFREWVDEQRDSRWQAMAATSANYESSFDTWNKRADFA